jgi:hypothetical protein
MLKKVLLTTLLVIPLRVFAPAEKFIAAVPRPEPDNPFQALINAIGCVENKGDTLAWNPVEQAAGFFQIRPIRLNDYNRRTGSKLKLRDMFDYEKSERVFLYYASRIGYRDFEKIAKSWNGSGSRTINYWNQVKKHL